MKMTSAESMMTAGSMVLVSLSSRGGASGGESLAGPTPGRFLPRRLSLNSGSSLVLRLRKDPQCCEEIRLVADGADHAEAHSQGRAAQACSRRLEPTAITEAAIVAAVCTGRGRRL